MKTKICGMKYGDNIREVLRLPIDYMGFIFYAKSKRYVDHLDLSVFYNSSIQKVGVFVDSPITEVQKKIQDFQLDGIQLHGSETAEQCAELRTSGKFIWKAIGIDNTFDFSTLPPYTDVVDCFVFDTSSPQHGGTGRVFDWELLKSYPYDVPYFLSGGLDLVNIPSALAITDERLIGLDINSKFEVKPGLKDIDKLQQALKIIRHE